MVAVEAAEVAGEIRIATGGGSSQLDRVDTNS